MRHITQEELDSLQYGDKIVIMNDITESILLGNAVSPMKIYEGDTLTFTEHQNLGYEPEHPKVAKVMECDWKFDKYAISHIIRRREINKPSEGAISSLLFE